MFKTFNATIETTVGTYYIDQKQVNGEPLFAVIYNSLVTSGGSSAVYFGSVEEAISWVKEHSEYYSNQAA